MFLAVCQQLTTYFSWAVLGRLIGGGANVVTAQYLRRVVPGRVTLGAEYQAQLGAGSQVKSVTLAMYI